jgi:SAM-dependent methyltransferase
MRGAIRKGLRGLIPNALLDWRGRQARLKKYRFEVRPLAEGWSECRVIEALHDGEARFTSYLPASVQEAGAILDLLPHLWYSRRYRLGWALAYAADLRRLLSDVGRPLTLLTVGYKYDTWDLQYLAACGYNLRATLLDLSPPPPRSQFESLPGLRPEQVRYVQADALDLPAPLRSAGFDAALICRDSIDWLPGEKWLRALEGIAACLKPGGFMLYSMEGLRADAQEDRILQTQRIPEPRHASYKFNMSAFNLEPHDYLFFFPGHDRPPGDLFEKRLIPDYHNYVRRQGLLSYQPHLEAVNRENAARATTVGGLLGRVIDASLLPGQVEIGTVDVFTSESGGHPRFWQRTTLVSRL